MAEATSSSIILVLVCSSSHLNQVKVVLDGDPTTVSYLCSERMGERMGEREDDKHKGTVQWSARRGGGKRGKGGTTLEIQSVPASPASQNIYICKDTCVYI